MMNANATRACRPWPLVRWWWVVAAVVAATLVVGAAEPAAPPPGAGGPVAPGPVPGEVPPPVVEILPDGAARLGGITVDPRTRSVSFAGTLNAGLADVVLEVVIATPKGRLHEALLWADISPLTLQSCLYLLKLSNGPRLTDSTGRRGDVLDIDLEYTAADGKAVREPVENWIRDTRTGKRLQRLGWVFTGTTMRDGAFLAEVEGNICINYSVGSTILDSADPQAVEDTIHVLEPGRAEPKPGAPVRVILSVRGKAP
jgi:hypothetical protein